MTDYASGKLGGIQFPVAPAITNGLFKDADPALYYAADFFAAMIRTHIGARLVAEAAAVGYPVTDAVMQVFPWDPAPFLHALMAKLPLLAIHRKSAKYTEHTVGRRRRSASVDVIYVLPPLKGSEMQRLAPVLQAVGAILNNRLELGMDPTYTPPGGAPGGKVWKAAGIDRILFESDSIGAYADAEKDLYLPCWTGNLLVHETSAGVAADFLKLSAIGVQIDLASPSAPTVEAFVEDDTTIPP